MEEKRKMIHKILDLVMDINSFEARNQDETGNKPTAFFEFGGHVANVTARVYKDGWKYRGDYVNFETPLDRELYKNALLCKEYSLEDTIKELKEIKKELEEKGNE